MTTFFPIKGKPFLVKMVFAAVIVISSFFQGYAISINQHRDLKWYPVQKSEISVGDTVRLFKFQGASMQMNVHGLLPVYQEMFPLTSPDDKLISLSLEKQVFREIPQEQLSGLKNLEKIQTSIILEYAISTQRTKSFLCISFVPIRKNPEKGTFEQLISFDINYQIQPNANSIPNKSTRVYADHSVLSTGAWYKMAIPASGIYVLQAKDLKNIDPGFSTADPATIQIFGNNGGMLPEANSTSRVDDLRELSIQVVGSDPTKLNDNDYIIFYAKGPDTWSYNSSDQLFHQTKNIYSNYSYCFLTYGQNTGKRVVSEASVPDIPNTTINRFNDFTFYEPAEINLIKSGRSWYSKDIFELTVSRDYSFTFADLDYNFPVTINATVAAHCTSSVPTSFTLSANGQELSTVSIPIVGSLYTDIYAIDASILKTYTSTVPTIDIKLDYTRPLSDGIGYLRSLEMNYIRNLVLSNGQMAFRSVTGTSPGLISKFQLSAGTIPVTVWDVTDPGAVKSIVTSQSNNLVSFELHTDSLREFTAFDGTLFFPVQNFAKIDNQDLHSTGTPDFVIVTNPAFINQANTLAEFHQQHDNMSVLVTTPDKIYNEFSSGAQDITGIRDFIKMIYDRSSKAAPKYLLMFGDASYDYKDRLTGNTNFVPTYESNESLDPVNTFVTDDYFGILDDGEGQGTSGFIDVGVGRFPVRTTDQADASVAKVIHYCSNSDTVKQDWRNLICFVAEDYDSGMHEQNADNVIIQDSSYNEDKIYMGAYDRIYTPGGLRYPEVNDAITRRIEKGALLMNYVGHGGVLGWAHARILEIPQIKAWKNFDNMPVFITATCEFSYFDDPSFTSAGEEVFLNPQGGAIALLTTTRPTYASDNQYLINGVYNNAFVKTNGKYPTLGDLIMISKNFASGSNSFDPNARKFVLLGDPALQMAYPVLHVVTKSIVSNKQTSGSDTLKALSTVTITGEIQDDNGSKVTNFNGTVYPTIYDKPSSITTVPLEGENPFHFMLRKNVLYKGKIAVNNGAFSFTFIVPKDIAYNFGGGKISYYASDKLTDANGYDMNIIVGGYDNNAASDTSGPAIRLFINDTAFVSGGITDQNPKLLAYLADSSGINTVGNGIGHDLTADLDNNSKSPMILNDYYVTDLNTFKKGVITYPMTGLSDGMHTVSIRVWDVYNNSSEASIDFLVVSSSQLAIQHLFNYPNPFFDKTTFSFEFNQPNTDMTLRIDIYSLTGQKVKTLRQPLYSNGYRVNTIEWDGSSDNGVRIGSGIYVYNVSLTMPDGSTMQKSSKLMVVR